MFFKMWHNTIDIQSLHPNGDPNVIFCDLEFTGDASKDVPQHCHVYHIAAVKANDGDNCFEAFVQPMCTDAVLKNAHVSITREQLQARGAVSAAQAFSQFEHWLYTSQTQHDEPIVLVFHNAKIDAAILVHELRRCGVGLRHPQVGSLCSLGWARYANQNISSYSLESLAHHYLGNTEPFGASHSALNDCRTLRAVVQKMVSVERKTLSGVVLPLGYVSLQSVPGIGAGVEIALVRKGCCCVQQLLSHVQNIHGGCINSNLIHSVLRDKVPNVAWANDIGTKVLRVARAHGM